MNMEQNYWDRAGSSGYLAAIYKDTTVGSHITGRIWAEAVEFSARLGVQRNARVMDLGCGDGAFSNHMLAKGFAKVEGFELSTNAVARANANKAGAHLTFTACDITTLDYTKLGRFDAAFMIGILHHVKPAAPEIVKAIRGITDKVVVLEPNGDHLARKLLELTPSYRAAGEDSFRKTTLIRMFSEAGFSLMEHKQINIFPNFTPKIVFEKLQFLEPIVEQSALLRGLCTNGLFAFKAG